MTRSSEELEAMQAVVQRVVSYQDGATEGTTEKELRSAFGETDIDPSEDEITKLVDAIEADPASADAASVLG
ncbi:hypothetical protein [Nocardioides aquaticus]|jgi:hypothetical protein|nr:hypothetical protein [Nocardioides aquaticus]